MIAPKLARVSLDQWCALGDDTRPWLGLDKPGPTEGGCIQRRSAQPGMLKPMASGVRISILPGGGQLGAT
jgi:hypothetical protein